MTRGFREVGLCLPLLAFNSFHVVSQKEQTALLPEPSAGSGAPCLQAQDELGDFSRSHRSVSHAVPGKDRHWLGAGTEGWCDSSSGANPSLTFVFVRTQHMGGLVLARRCRPSRACDCKQQQGLGRREVSRAALNARLSSFPVPQNQGHKRLW